MTKMDDDVPATRGDLELLRTELKTDISELKTDITELRTELKTDISELRTELRAEFETFERKFEATLTRTINAAYESFRSDFRVLDDQDKAISERGARQIGNVLAELDAHREDPKAHRRR